MFRSRNNEGRFSDGQSPSASGRPAVTSAGLGSQESSWLGLLSRPALSLLRRLRPWSAAPSGFTGDNEFLRELNEILPLALPGPAHLTFQRCQHHGTAGLLEPGAGGSVPWLTAVSLRDGGTRSPGDMELSQQQTQAGYLSSVRTVVHQVLLNPQELQPAGGWASVSPPVRRGSAGKGGPWWGSLLWEEESSLWGLQSELSRPEWGADTDGLCPQAAARTKAPTAETSPVLEWMLGENTGPPNNKSLHTVQNMGGCTVDRQDLGYSSPEEEMSQRGLLSQVRVPCEEQDPPTPEMEEGQTGPEEDQCGGATVQCQNKTIAFIMGCPCSDDSQSESTDDDDDDDDDDGFSSEGSSEYEDDEDEDEDDEDEEDSDSDSEPDSESERLWTSLCQTVDPYNPQNFTARLQTSRTSPQTTPTPSPQPSPSPLSVQDVWDDSTSASEVDEAESLRLLSSFSCSSDPYSPLNFQGPLRTQGPPRPLVSNTAPQASVYDPTSAPEYKKDEAAEDRLDSGFSEAPPPVFSSASTAQSCRKFKKVQFCDDVDEFFASCGEEEEDRRGPWEELARDRCRFLRRCEEVEQSIGYCLQPQHRRRILQKLGVPDT